MSFMAPGDALREQDARRFREAQEQAAAVERAKQDRIERWGEALSVLPLEELQQLAQGWSSLTEAIKPAAQRAADIKQGRKKWDRNAQ